MKVVPTVIYDTSGNVEKIEFYNELGSFEFQALWDPTDTQTSENREAFRKWSYATAENMGFIVFK